MIHPRRFGGLLDKVSEEARRIEMSDALKVKILRVALRDLYNAYRETYGQEHELGPDERAVVFQARDALEQTKARPDPR